MKPLMILNPAAKGGSAETVWQTIAAKLPESKEWDIVVTAERASYRAIISDALADGRRHFVSASGDGGVNAIVNEIARCPHRPKLDRICLGAIGMGSSNDFLKPFDRRIAGCPIKVDFEKRRPRDIVCARDSDGDDFFFAVSASLGLVAEANRAFNELMGLGRFLKRRATSLAILVAFFKTWRGWRDIPVLIRIEGREHRYEASYIAISKTPFISGMFRFGTPIAPDDGKLLVKALHDSSRIELLSALVRLSKGREEGIAKLDTFVCERLKIDVAGGTVFECDGEIRLARSLELSVFPERLMVCG